MSSLRNSLLKGWRRRNREERRRREEESKLELEEEARRLEAERTGKITWEQEDKLVVSLKREENDYVEEPTRRPKMRSSKPIPVEDMEQTLEEERNDISWNPKGRMANNKEEVGTPSSSPPSSPGPPTVRRDSFFASAESPPVMKVNKSRAQEKRRRMASLFEVGKTREEEVEAERRDIGKNLYGDDADDDDGSSSSSSGSAIVKKGPPVPAPRSAPRRDFQTKELLLGGYDAVYEAGRAGEDTSEEEERGQILIDKLTTQADHDDQDYDEDETSSDDEESSIQEDREPKY